MDFSGRAVVVSGGTSGIGLAIAQAFRTAGAEVTVTGTRAREAYGADLEGLEHRLLDVGDDAAVKGFVEAWGARPLDILVNAVGTVRYRQAEYEIEVFRQVMDVNLTGVFHLCRLFRDALAASAAAGGPGCVVNIGSLACFRATANNPAYSASKGGLGLLTKTLAARWGRSGVRVNAIAPGFVESKLTAVSSNDPAIRDDIIRRTPLGRWGRPGDLAGPALWLASPAAAFVTGAIIPVDGGYSLAL